MLIIFVVGFLQAYSPKPSFLLVLKSFQICAIYTPMIIPCLALQYWFQPCKPFAPGFWILDECNAALWSTFTLKGLALQD